MRNFDEIYNDFEKQYDSKCQRKNMKLGQTKKDNIENIPRL